MPTIIDNHPSVPALSFPKLIHQPYQTQKRTHNSLQNSLIDFNHRSFSSNKTRILKEKRSHMKSLSLGARGRPSKDQTKPLDSATKRDFKSSARLCDDSSDLQNSLTNGTDIWLPKTCGFIGGGQMADALLGGFLQKKAFKKENVVVSDISQER